MTAPILIVDGDPDLLSALNTFLELRGFQADAEPDPRRAAERIREGDYRVALLDIVMPEMDGLELLQIIRRERPEIEVVMLTANSTRQRVWAARELGAADFVLKPFSDFEMTGHVVMLALERSNRWLDVIQKSPSEPWQEVSLK